MKETSREELGFTDDMDGCDDRTSDFAIDWAASEAADRLGALRESCTSLPSVSPEIDMVQSDFSITGCKKDVYHKRLTDFTLVRFLN